MRPENRAMVRFLADNGIIAQVKYIATGSLRGCWRISNIDQRWSIFMANRLNLLGFTNFDCKPLGEFSGNGGMFQVFVRGHNELLHSECATA